jgi:hypothetical protein
MHMGGNSQSGQEYPMAEFIVEPLKSTDQNCRAIGAFPVGGEAQLLATQLTVRLWLKSTFGQTRGAGKQKMASGASEASFSTPSFSTP